MGMSMMTTIIFWWAHASPTQYFTSQNLLRSLRKPSVLLIKCMILMAGRQAVLMCCRDLYWHYVVLIRNINSGIVLGSFLTNDLRILNLSIYFWFNLDFPWQENNLAERDVRELSCWITNHSSLCHGWIRFICGSQRDPRENGKRCSSTPMESISTIPHLRVPVLVKL